MERRKIKKRENICIRRAHLLDPIHMQCNTYTNNTFHQAKQTKAKGREFNTSFATSKQHRDDDDDDKDESDDPVQWKWRETNPYCLQNVCLYWSDQKS